MCVTLSSRNPNWEKMDIKDIERKVFRMKRGLVVLCALMMTFALNGCGEVDYSGTTVTGQVTKIEGTKVTLQLGELAEMERPEGMFGGENGEMPAMPEGGFGGENGEMPAMPEGMFGGEKGEMPSQPKNQDWSLQGSTGDVDWGVQEGGGMPDMSEGFGGIMTGAASNFTAGEETLIVDLADVDISFGFGQMTMKGDISMISENSILMIEFGEDNTIVSVTVQGGFGGRGGMKMFEDDKTKQSADVA